ncbi:hypothetical protein NF865_01930 [Thermococcus aggregans]|uniref:Uncharacterized protein n=1 Tax=Thermococcus aggregans TaxID=110163 RepID=A0A9E7SP08_THEAG|nr:hypothetical protein [Thermococcus aggregans]USS41003.1 hypothetical protein NF865_01930 [Thermococcus aggregans]
MEKLIVFSLSLIFSVGILVATYVNTKRIIVKPLVLAVLVSGIAGSLLIALNSSFIEYGTFAIFLCVLLWGYKNLIFERFSLINRVWSLLSILNLILFVLVLIHSTIRL